MAHEAQCGQLTPEDGFFQASSEGGAYTALQAFEGAVHMARDRHPRAVTVDCTSLESLCPDGKRFLAQLGAGSITGVTRQPCATDPSGCWRFGFSDRERGPFELVIDRLNRPMQVTIVRVPVPVS